MNVVTKSTFPRDINELQKLNRAQLVRLAVQLGLLDDDVKNQTFKVMTQDQMAQEVLNALQAMDAAGGTPNQVAPPMPAQPAQQYPPQQYPPQQYQQQPYQQQYPQPVQPLAPPPQVAPPVPPPPQPQQMPGGPPVPPPTAPMPGPTAQYAAPIPGGYPMPQQQAAPWAPVAPPQPQPPSPMVPPMNLAPYPQPTMPGAGGYPPPAAPQAPPAQTMRQPQTTSDPTNAGASQGSSETMRSLVGILGEMNRGVSQIGVEIRGSVTIQRIILKTLLGIAEQQGISAEDMAKLVRLQDDQEVEKFVQALGNPLGKS